MTTAELAALREQLIAHEGRRAKPYVDTVGKITIGCGRNLTDKGLTDSEIMRLLDGDIDECLTDLMSFPWFLRLDGCRQRALVDFRFNVGRAGFRGFPKFIAAMAAGDHIGAAWEWSASKWAHDIQPARRDRLIHMLKTGADIV